MFLGWGALVGLVLAVVFAFVSTFAPEPVAFILAALAVAFVWWISLRATSDGRSRTP